MNGHEFRLAMRMTRIDLGLEPGRDNSVRFVVLSRPRTGSNLVIESLKLHPGALTCGEIFCDSRTCYVQPYPELPWTVTCRNVFPVGFLRRRIFRRMPLSVDACGFKLLYYQCGTRWSKRVWSFLQRHDDLRVVHIRRRNILRTHLSFQKALCTDHWIQFEDGDFDQATVWLDPDECERTFVETRKKEMEIDAFFDHQPKLELYYEDLSERYVEEMGRVCNFLGLDPPAEMPPIRKQANMSLSASIENYAELKRRFHGTEWASFFEE